jgi:hypothetical protein
MVFKKIYRWYSSLVDYKLRSLVLDNAVYSLLNKILTALNNKAKAKGIFCDIEKAFDCVNHNILLHKLEIYGLEFPRTYIPNT